MASLLDSDVTRTVSEAGAGGALGRVRLGKKTNPLGTFNLIHLRPEVASARSEVGHFEGDLIIGAGGRSAIVTLVDRATRFNLLSVLAGVHGAENVLACCTQLLERGHPWSCAHH